MPTSRRNFLRVATASTTYISLPHHFRPLLASENLQSKLAADPLRPQFHLLPAKNWMNDPNGPIYWKGLYHIFFQYNPNAAVWGDMHWAHAISDDMIHWRHLPVALAPTPAWDDADGCFTGSAVDDHGTATILYTGVKSVAPERATLRDGHSNFREVQCLATSADPHLLTWTKWKQPVIEPPADPQLAGFRDPFLFRHGGDWILGIGSGHFKKGGCVLLYRSRDLRAWEPLHELASRPWTEKESTNPVDSGEMWECPDFFRLGKKHVLLYSTAGKVIWESGELDPQELKFHSERQGILDHGAYYAQKTQLDARGNRILWGWIPEKRPDSELIAAGWAGCMSLPRVLSLSPEGDLQMNVADEARSLRGKVLLPLSNHIEPRFNPLDRVSFEGLRAELLFKFLATTFTLVLVDRAGPWWSLSAKLRDTTLTLTVNGSSFDIPSLPKSEHTFHLFLDGSVAELIVDSRHAITSRIYRQPDGPLHIQPDGPLRTQPHGSNLLSVALFHAWQLRPISPGRFTT